jgi:probable HAF family extracellular repeat protein
MSKACFKYLDSCLAFWAEVSVLIFAVVFFFSTANASPTPLYSVTLLTPVGFSGTRANAINSSGQVAMTGFLPAGGPSRALVVGTGGGDPSTEIGIGTPYAINNSGQVAGCCAPFPFLYSPSGSLQSLGTLGGPGGVAYGLNDQGAVVGGSNLLNSPTYSPFLWTASGGMQEIGNREGVAYGINSVGEIVGWTCSNGDCSTTSAFFLRPGSGIAYLGTFGGLYSTAYALNDAGLVVGSAHTGAVDQNGRVYRAFAANLAQNSLDSSKVDLGTLGGSSSVAYAVNESGAIVGEAQTGASYPGGGGPISHAFLFYGGQMQDLNDLVPTGFISQYGPLIDARGINANGQIVANTNSLSFLLTPIGTGTSDVPEPASFVLVAAGLALSSVIQNRRKAQKAVN